MEPNNNRLMDRDGKRIAKSYQKIYQNGDHWYGPFYLDMGSEFVISKSEDWTVKKCFAAALRFYQLKIL